MFRDPPPAPWDWSDTGGLLLAGAGSVPELGSAVKIGLPALRELLLVQRPFLGLPFGVAAGPILLLQRRAVLLLRIDTVLALEPALERHGRSGLNRTFYTAIGASGPIPVLEHVTLWTAGRKGAIPRAGPGMCSRPIRWTVPTRKALRRAKACDDQQCHTHSKQSLHLSHSFVGMQGPLRFPLRTRITLSSALPSPYGARHNTGQLPMRIACARLR